MRSTSILKERRLFACCDLVTVSGPSDNPKSDHIAKGSFRPGFFPDLLVSMSVSSAMRLFIRPGSARTIQKRGRDKFCLTMDEEIETETVRQGRLYSCYR